MKHKNQLLIDPRNWTDVKKEVPGLEALLAEARRQKYMPPYVKFNPSKISVHRANSGHYESMRTLAQNDLRPLNMKEALLSVIQNPGLKEQLKGELFFIGGVGFDKMGIHTIGSSLSLIEGGSTDLERNADCWPGSTNPLMFRVYLDGHAIANNARFGIGVCASTDVCASVIVGVPRSIPEDSVLDAIM